MYKLRKIALFIVAVLGCTLAYPQSATLTGIIFDQASGTPIQYANITLYPTQDSLRLMGAITDEKGAFEVENIPFGRYFLKISFIGYDAWKNDSFLIDRESVNLGKISLSLLQENIDEITVQAQKKGISYLVDRKIINAKSFPGAQKAIDLLENVPSLQLGIDGRLTYRGDGTFLVYINGRPEQNGVEKLRQLSVDQIQYIEIITNPTAKYDAEGTAGIIQVILKRNRLEGYSISSSISTSTLGSLEWLFSIDRKGKKGGWYINGQANDYVERKQRVHTNQSIISGETIIESVSDLTKKESVNNPNLEFGFNYDLSNKDYVDFMLSADPFHRSNKCRDYGGYSDTVTAFSEIMSAENYRYDSHFEMYYRYLRSVLTYEHAFTKDRSHLLTTYIDYSTYLHPLDESKTDIKEYENHTEILGYNAREYNELILEANAAYKNKLSERSTLELGAQVTLDHIPKLTSESGTFDDENNLTPFPEQKQDQKVDFKQDIYSGFLTFESSFGKLDYKLGLRAEFTDRKSDFSYIDNSPGEVKVHADNQFTDFFPSAHFVYNFSEKNQLSVSYSRRINRAGYWELIPLKRYESPYIYYTGNGNLMPSYASAYELGYLRSWGDNFISAEVFARNNTGLIQSYYHVDGDNQIVWTKENVGESLSIGAEFMTGYDLFKWWNINLSTSLYSYRLKVDTDDEMRTGEQLRGDIKFNNIFNLSRTLSLRYQLTYQSKTIAAQVERNGYLYSNLIFRKSFFKRKWEAEVAWSNIFDSIRYSTTTRGTNLYVESDFVRQPYLSFKLSYRFNNQN